jgi:hypothetical protein
MHKIEITHSRYLGIKEARLFEKRTIKILGLSFEVWKETDFYRSEKIGIQVSAWVEMYSVPFDNIKDYTKETINQN